MHMASDTARIMAGMTSLARNLVAREGPKVPVCLSVCLSVPVYVPVSVCLCPRLWSPTDPVPCAY